MLWKHCTAYWSIPHFNPPGTICWEKKKNQTKKRVLQSSDFAGGKEVSGKVGGIRGVCEEEKKQIGLQELNSEIAEVTDTENTQQQ